MPLCNRCCDDGVIQQPPLPQQTFFQLLYFMDLRMVDPLMKDIPHVVHSIQIRRIGWHHHYEDELWCFSLQQCDNVTCMDVISLTSALHHQVRDVRDM